MTLQIVALCVLFWACVVHTAFLNHYLREDYAPGIVLSIVLLGVCSLLAAPQIISLTGGPK